jgi:hypothetical protein
MIETIVFVIDLKRHTRGQPKYPLVLICTVATTHAGAGMAESSATEPVELTQAALKVLPSSVLKPHFARPADKVSMSDRSRNQWLKATCIALSAPSVQPATFSFFRLHSRPLVSLSDLVGEMVQVCQRAFQ